MASCGGTILIDESIEGHQMSNTAFVASVTNFDTIFYDQTSAIQSVALEVRPYAKVASGEVMLTLT